MSSSKALTVGGPHTVDQIVKAHTLEVLRQARSLGQAASTLGINEATLWRQRKKWGILKEFKP